MDTSSLFKAAKSGDVAALHKLASGSEPELLLSPLNPYGNTGLHIAVMLGHEVFAKESCSLDQSLLLVPNSNGDSPLILAAMVGVCALATFFIQSLQRERLREMLLMKNKGGNTALHEALRGSHGGLALEMLRAEPELAKSVNNVDESPMFMAAARGLVDVVSALLKYPDSEHGGPGDETALHAAVRMDHSDIVRIIMKERPELGKLQEGKDGCTPLHYAAWCNQLEMVRLLLAFDTSLAYISSNNGSSPILYAAYCNHARIVRELVQQCPDSALLVNERGENAIHAAIMYTNIDVVKYIVEAPELQLLINRPDNKGNTPLHMAADRTQSQTVFALLSNSKLDRAARNKDGHTAISTFYRNVDMTNTLQWHETHLLLTRGIKDHFINTWNMPRKTVASNALKEIKSLTETYTNNTTVVAILMSTVTFAAAFTVPGGYQGNDGPDQGLPILARKVAFKVFLISDAMSMCASLAIAFLCIFARLDIDFLAHYKGSTKKLLWFAFVMMMIAFATGMYTVVAPDNLWLAILLCVMCCVLPFFTYIIAKWPLWKLGFRVGQGIKPDVFEEV